MTSRTHLKQLQDLKASIPEPPDGGERMLVVYPDRWPVEVQASYQAAGDAGDIERQFTIIEQQDGARPSRRPEAIVIHIRRVPMALSRKAEVVG